MIKSVSQLKANPKNPRKISEQKIKMLKASLDEFGDLNGVIFNETSNQLAGGTQRLKCVPANSEIEIINTYNPPTRTGTVAEGYILVHGERFNYRVVRWDKSKEKAANIAANKGAGEWDFPQLTEWIHELDGDNYDLSLTMHDKDELDRLMGGWNSDTEGVGDVEENLDGIVATIKIKCPQEIFDEVSIYIKGKLLETSFTGVEFV